VKGVLTRAVVTTEGKVAPTTPEAWEKTIAQWKAAGKSKFGGKKGWSKRIDEIYGFWRRAEETAEVLRTENALLRTVIASLKAEIRELESEVTTQ
jgi:hypothetical protein